MLQSDILCVREKSMPFILHHGVLEISTNHHAVLYYCTAAYSCTVVTSIYTYYILR